ncbi:MAG: ribonuclease III [Muribaculaceae bacterium]|nr:ribonuclease III [Muribaculaceae bacterium]
MTRYLKSLIKLLLGKDKELYRFCRKTIGYIPRNIELYKLAFVHKSVGKRDKSGHLICNERLEFLGDAVLDTIIANYLYHKFPHKHEGYLTNMRSRIVQRESLNRVGKKLGLDKVLEVALHSSAHNSYVYGNAVEALVGAIYLDLGYKVCRKFVEKQILGKTINMGKLLRTETNYKSRLIEWTQKERVHIEYSLINEVFDETNSPVFTILLTLNGIEAATATGFSKKQAHQQASKMAWNRLHNDPAFRQSVIDSY